MEMDLTSTNVNEVHQELTQMAADIANGNPQKHPLFFFHPLSVGATNTVDGTDGLALEWDRGEVVSSLSARKRKETIDSMNRIGRDAFREAISRKAEMFVGLIVGSARNQQNYFDYFTDLSDKEAII